MRNINQTDKNAKIQISLNIPIQKKQRIRKFTTQIKIFIKIKSQSKIQLINQNQTQSYQLISSITSNMTQKYLKPIICASLAIMVYQGIANSNLGIISQFTHQNGNNWAGPLSTALLFLGSGLASNYNRYIGKYPFKFCFFVGSFGYTVFTSLGLLFLKLGFTTTVQVLIFVLSFISGATCSIFYNSQFNYTNFLAKIDRRQVKYFGINMGITQSCNIFGNLLSSLIIEPLGQFTSVLIMSIIIFTTSFSFLLFKQPQKQEMALLDQTQKQQNQKLSIAQSDNSSLIPDEKQQIDQGRPPFLAYPAFIFSGMVISFIYCLISIILYKTFEDKMEDTQLNRLTFVLFIFEGVGEFLGGMALIFLSKYIKDVAKTLIVTTTLFIISAGIIMLASIMQNPYIFGVGIVLTGFADCSSFSLSLTLAGNWKQSGITAFNMCQSITVAVTVMISSFVPIWVSLTIFGCIYLCCLVCMFLYSKKTHLHIKKDETSSP